jgi:DNA topoisomerase-2
MPSNKESKVLAKKYQKKTDREHILDAPDTYIGSVEQDEDIEWMLDENNIMRRKKYAWVPGMFKCFDEGMVNCRDHFVRLNEKIKNKEKNIYL